MSSLILGFFEHLNPNGMSGASWSHPRNTSTNYLTLDYWISLAKRLDEAGADFLFLADSYGMPIVDGAVPEAALRVAQHIPTADPFGIASAVLAATNDLGLVITSSTVFEEPYANARRFATLDHLSGGRMGWNVVTSASAASASAMFGRELTPHDTRYDMADDYMELSYRLLEGSWEDDAVVQDRDARVYARASGVHRVDYEGEYFRAHGVFPVEPSPQRTPVVFQAGSSGRGRAFAAAHAECVFLQGTTVPAVAASVADIRAQAVGLGRDATDVKILVGLTVITAPTAEEAAQKYEEFRSFSTDESAAVQFAYNTGIDLLSMDPDKPLGDVAANQGQSNVDRFRGGPDTPAPTVREILDELRGRGLRGLVLVGRPEQVADEIEAYVESTGVDGFLLESYLNPGTYDDILGLLLPVLRERGVVEPFREAGSLRERLAGGGTAHL
ncbi:MAG: hypothetical protein JWP75_1694, partial [Frondihabitans sp.]|nr:hypothetical protein [Frondihabitans sp.]